MKFGKIHLLLLVVLLIASFVSGLPNICRYGKKQMTLGQKIINCYVIISCERNGVIKIRDACSNYSCVRPSKPLGYKIFDPSKPYPSCCGGPICGGNKIPHSLAKGTYIFTTE